MINTRSQEIFKFVQRCGYLWNRRRFKMEVLEVFGFGNQRVAVEYQNLKISTTSHFNISPQRAFEINSKPSPLPKYPLSSRTSQRLVFVKLLILIFNMASIEKRNSLARQQKLVSRPKPQQDAPERDQLEFLLFQPKDRPKSLKMMRQNSLKKPSPNISLGLPQRPSERNSIAEGSGNQAPVIFYVENRQDRRTKESRPKSRMDQIPALSSRRDSSKPVAVKNMPATLPAIKFPKIENQPLPPYYISNLVKALEDQTSSQKLAPYRDQFDQLCEAVSLYADSQTKPSGKIVLPKADCLKKTVILDIDETLIHSSHASDPSNSMRRQAVDGEIDHLKIHVRPYCRQFLSELSKVAEIIIFTAGNSRYADAVLAELDPENKYIAHRLYREHCSFRKNYFLKDIREINRRQSDMVIVDNSPFSYALNIDNAVPILPFYGNSKDVELKSLLGYLQEVVKVKDVRAANRSHFKLNQYVQDFLSITNSEQ